ncbi:MAG: NCS2 family permease [Leptospiraceae bacterium]|nr:NCS2 family permease [Leptospiraceae bacterium]MCK6380777.1 NCS2 family permease [Leptospiraceae bacterium]NUM41620.1 NCS2 family permease [Leptospiraceae bacterium]
MQNSFRWFVKGDLDGFFGLVVDNLIQLLVILGLCHSLCGFPFEFIYKVILPGVAVSLVIGNILYSIQARKLAIKENRNDVTALPYGINTVSLFAFIFFVISPVYNSTKDYTLAWKIGLLASFTSGLIEFFGSFVAEKIRKITPRAALLSALAGIAITFISMDFLIRTYQNPLVAFIPFGVILLQYFGKVKFPFHLPGGLISVLLGISLAWMSGFWGKPMMDKTLLSDSVQYISFYFPILSIQDLYSVFNLVNIKEYLSVIIPMGIFNVIGSLQNIESAEAAGDKFHTRNSLLINGTGTLIGAIFGSPFPTTIYIGHPGWKGIGARYGYSILNGIFITLICIFGFMGLIKALVPIEAGMAIILWIGIIIGSQAFESSPKRHAPAIIVGLFPALAGWAVLLVQNSFLFANGKLSEILATEKITKPYSIALSELPSDLPFLPYPIGGLLSLSQGFLLVSMIWAAIIVFIIDRDFIRSAYWCVIAAILSSIGIIHSYILKGNSILNDYSFLSSTTFTQGYLLLSGLFFLIHFFENRNTK